MRSTNREIRLLLKLLRRPHALDRNPLAIMLREALHVESAHRAVVIAIRTAFETATPNGRLLHEVIKRCDVDGQTTAAAAADMNLSVRQFFRYRREAVEALAQTVGRSLRQPDESSRKQLLLASMVAEFDSRAALDMYVRAAPSPTGKTAFEIARAAIWAGVDPSPYIGVCEGAWRLLALTNQARRFLSIGMRAESEALADEVRAALDGSSGPLYDAVAFEIAELDRRALRRRGLTRDEADVIERMRTLAHDDSRLLALTLLAEAEAACSAGELTAGEVAVADAERIAVERRELDLLARAAFASASLSFLRNQMKDALALFNATASTIAAFDAAYALRAASFAARSALQLGADWKPPRDLMERHSGSWILAELECIDARRLLPLDPKRALAIAEPALERARKTDAAVATLYARATVAAATDACGRAAEAKRFWLNCWCEGMQLDDHLTLFDLFVVPGAVERDYGPIALDDDLLEAVQRFHEERWPDMPSSLSACVRTLKIDLLRMCVAGAIGRRIDSRLAEDSMRAAARRLSDLQIPGVSVLRLGHSMSRVTSLALSWLFPPLRRPQFRAAFVSQCDHVVAEIVARMDA